MSIDSTKKSKVSWFDLLTQMLQYLQHYDITLICKKYSKFIKEFEQFINDLSITWSVCSTRVFDCYLCGIQYKKNCFFLKKSLTLLCSICKLYYEFDNHLFGENIHKKSLWNHLGVTNILTLPRETSIGRFSKNTPTHSYRNIQSWQL